MTEKSECKDVNTKRYHKFIENFIVIPGEHIWFVNSANPEIKRYTISNIRHHTNIHFFGKHWKEKYSDKNWRDDVYITLTDFKLSADSHTCIAHSWTNGAKYYICSTENKALEILVDLVIPELISKHTAVLLRNRVNNTRAKSLKEEIKKLQKLSKNITIYLLNLIENE